MGFPVECWDAGEKKSGKCYHTILFCIFLLTSIFNITRFIIYLVFPFCFCVC